MATCILWWINVDSYNFLIKIKFSKVLDELEKQYDEIAALDGLPFQEFLAKKTAVEEKLKASANPFTAGILPALVPGTPEAALVALRDFGTKAFAEVVEPALASYVPVGRTVATERGVDTGVGTGVGTGVATGGGTGVETGVGTGVGVGATTPHGIENRTEYSLLPSGA